MSQYLLEDRIEEPVWLEPIDISFLRERISETETQVESLQNQMSEVKRAHEAYIEEQITLEPNEVSFLESRMSESETQAQISELTRQRDMKLVELASFRNILSPVRRIPVEILSEILELACLPEDGIFHSKHTIVLYTNNLSSLCFEDDNTNVKPVTTTVEWVKEWTHRSRGLLLDVYLSLSMESYLRSTQLLEQILSLRHRIRTLDVAGYSGLYHVLFCLPRSSFSRLEEITLSIEGNDVNGRLLPNKIEALLDAPHLHNVQIRGTSISPY
ncbi:hypothetical protein BT96DRAFT_1014292 [Gymnopus androsaceus JB14]|uniref:F-box domain-containing protein n=1 Tax=Gymnopus androsaceus JB14 TaxID=1447944 RepID=A0A6A4IAZ6_9AGAR|nr:hypothetical protein BT96DRAFT_1014292 [Gymnopus androsaceus JB14]